MIALKNELKKGVAVIYLQTDLEISNVALGLSMASNSKRSQLSDDDVDLLLGSSNDKDSDDNSDLDSCYRENDDDTLHASDEEGGSSVNAILSGAPSAGAAADNDGWITQGQLRLRFPFSGNPAIKVNIADADDPLAYFELFFDDTLINMIVQQTNLYAKQYLDLQRSTLRKRSRSQEWIDTNEKEIRVDLGLLLLQGIVQKLVTNLFFSKRKKSIQTSLFPATIKRERFLFLRNSFISMTIKAIKEISFTNSSKHG